MATATATATATPPPATPPAASAGAPPRWHRLAVVAAVAIGAAARVAVLRSPVLGITDSDEAVLGLIAIRMRSGQPFAMYWGQAYGGTIESAVAAVGFLVTGPSVVTAKLVPVAFSAATALLVWRIGARVFPRPSAALAGAVAWATPAYFVYRSTNMNIYFGTLALATATVLLLQQLADGDVRRWWPVAFGLAAGAAWWSSPQAAFLLLPAAVAYAVPLVGNAKVVATAVPFAAVGGAPWLWWNVTNDWASVASPATDVSLPYLERVWSFFPQLSIVLGAREATSARWFAPSVTRPLVVVLVLVAAGLVAKAVVTRSRWWRIGAIAALFPFAYGLSPLSRFDGLTQPRYLTLATPLVALLLGGALGWIGERVAARATPAAAAAVAAALAVALAGWAGIGVRWFEQRDLMGFGGAPDAAVPKDFGDLVDLFDEHDVEHAYADYWVAFRATFEAGERTVVTPVQPHLARYQPYARRAEAAAGTALVTLTASSTSGTVPQRLDQLGVRYELVRRGAFQLVLPERTVPRADVVEAFHGRI